MSDKNLFYKTVYTPLSEAIKILEERQKDLKLKAKIEELLKGNIPEPLQQIGKNGVMFRQVATPNFEMRYFIELTKDHGLRTNFFEYHDDKFTSNNPYKHSLGQIRIHHDKRNKNGKTIEEKITIVDFAKYDGKPLNQVLTNNGEYIINIHKELFNLYNYHNNIYYDVSDWIKENGGHAVDYYTNFILLFIYHGILFENFLFTEQEGEFTKTVLLPSFDKALQLAGVKPLIVPIPPMDQDIEEDMHWHSYSSKIQPFINSKIL